MVLTNVLSMYSLVFSEYFYYFANILFLFIKQKTAYEMRISDWSSDVCSSDLSRFDGLRKPLEIASSTAMSGCASRNWWSLRATKIGGASCRERVCQYV